jgi:hypothetical protein
LHRQPTARPEILRTIYDLCPDHRPAVVQSVAAACYDGFAARVATQAIDPTESKLGVHCGVLAYQQLGVQTGVTYPSDARPAKEDGEALLDMLLFLLGSADPAPSNACSLQTKLPRMLLWLFQGHALHSDSESSAAAAPLRITEKLHVALEQLLQLWPWATPAFLKQMVRAWPRGAHASQTQECFFIQTMGLVLFHGSCNGHLMEQQEGYYDEEDYFLGDHDAAADSASAAAAAGADGKHPAHQAFAQLVRSLKLGGITVAAEALALVRSENVMMYYLGVCQPLYKIIATAVSKTTSHWNSDIRDQGDETFDMLLDYSHQ